MENRAALLDILSAPPAAGFLGRGDPEDHLTHTLGFVKDSRRSLLPGAPPGPLSGRGGGVPGLALALDVGRGQAVFIESAARRCQALKNGRSSSRDADRVRVCTVGPRSGRTRPTFRETFDLCNARSFARPRSRRRSPADS